MFGELTRILTRETANGPVITWLFDSEDGGTKLTLVFLEEGPHLVAGRARVIQVT